MPKLPFLTTVLLLAAVATAFAHAHLVTSAPADDSTLPTAPRALVLEFSEAARLTALALAGPGGAQQKLAPLPPDPAKRVSVALPPLTPGDYVVTWRALGADGHVTSGKIRFHLGQ
jgi:methionine-rich copper-binding protein CopC